MHAKASMLLNALVEASLKGSKAAADGTSAEDRGALYRIVGWPFWPPFLTAAWQQRGALQSRMGPKW